ncbi:MAG: hypothetical protein JHC26_08760 [Thermofilum sp.]|jgi:hypothetical protein|uniref:hypothetical protein n=1 Tax=Thermofilum sp. TaxID=1961369 RepID=UPI0025903E00|nr:hypothetical protein [Thermofilum sp.]MCI4409168.1 hypothetical protein [Thermofilum sp.]
MDLVDVVKQIYDIRDVVQKIFSDLGDNFIEMKNMLERVVELPSIDAGVLGHLVIEKNIEEERYLPFWIRPLWYPFTYMIGDKVIVDSLALHLDEDKGATFKLKLCFKMSSTAEFIPMPEKTYECTMFGFTLHKNKKDTVALGILIMFAYLTTDDDWRYIMDELNKFATRKSELENVVAQLKTAIATLKLVS